MLAGIAAGVYADPEDAAAHLVSVTREVAPNPAATRNYARQFQQYRVLYPALEELRKL